MLTYEDYLKVQGDEKKKVDFILKAIEEHKRSPAYLKAVSAQDYYDGLNTTIMKYEKLIYDLEGKAHVDMWTANHKITSSFFTFVIDQEVSYLLGNGVRFGKDGTKKKMGKNFDQRVMDALEYARIAGSAFGFWNLDHLDVFKFQEFRPIYGEETGALMLGIRFWKLDVNKPLRVTFYELDGYTEYIRRPGEELKIMAPKRAYISHKTTAADGTDITAGENYEGFPIIPLYANKKHASALEGKQNTLDALDLVSSNMVNNVDEGNLIYWVLTNCGGMDDMDDVKFIERIKTLHVAHADGDSGASAEPHTIEAPFDGTKATIDMLQERLFDDFQAFDAKSVTAQDMSATAIEAAYIRLDMKADKIEREVTQFINGILEIARIDDDPTYQRNKILNKMEETQSVIMQADYFDDEYIRKKLLAINGDIDLYEEIAKRMDAEDAQRMKDAMERIRQMEQQTGNQSGNQEENNDGNNGGVPNNDMGGNNNE